MSRRPHRRPAEPVMSPSKPRVVIIGGNFAGLVAASRLSCDHDVTVIDARADFEWTPNIHEILSGVKSRDGVVLPRAECVGRYGHTFMQDVVTGIDPGSNTVSTGSGLVLPYDACVVAAGSQRTTFGIEGAAEHALGLQLVDDAVRIASRLDKLAERQRRASVVIVGGGVSGIEALGEILRGTPRATILLFTSWSSSRTSSASNPRVLQAMSRRASRHTTSRCIPVLQSAK